MKVTYLHHTQSELDYLQLFHQDRTNLFGCILINRSFATEFQQILLHKNGKVNYHAPNGVLLYAFVIVLFFHIWWQLKASSIANVVFIANEHSLLSYFQGWVVWAGNLSNSFQLCGSNICI